MKRLFIDKMTIDNNSLLGPAPRLLLWVHGCNKKCPGCIAVDWNNALSAQYSLSVGTLIQLINANSDIEGITISGGEPFLQAEALSQLICNINKGIIIYSGYTKHELEQMSSEYVAAILKSIDVLIDGEYIEDLNDDKPFRGSSNQIIHQFTDRYNWFYSSDSKRNTQIEKKEGFLYLYGIPDKLTRTEWLMLKDNIE
ncbi:4Fe-4S single cluster domain-containing protein [Lachnospiraceae bacterium 48-33]